MRPGIRRPRGPGRGARRHRASRRDRRGWRRLGPQRAICPHWPIPANPNGDVLRLAVLPTPQARPRDRNPDCSHPKGWRRFASTSGYAASAKKSALPMCASTVALGSSRFPLPKPRRIRPILPDRRQPLTAECPINTANPGRTYLTRWLACEASALPLSYAPSVPDSTGPGRLLDRHRDPLARPRAGRRRALGRRSPVSEVPAPYRTHVRIGSGRRISAGRVRLEAVRARLVPFWTDTTCGELRLLHARDPAYPLQR